MGEEGMVSGRSELLSVKGDQVVTECKGTSDMHAANMDSVMCPVGIVATKARAGRWAGCACTDAADVAPMSCCRARSLACARRFAAAWDRILCICQLQANKEEGSGSCTGNRRCTAHPSHAIPEVGAVTGGCVAGSKWRGDAGLQMHLDRGHAKAHAAWALRGTAGHVHWRQHYVHDCERRHGSSYDAT